MSVYDELRSQLKTAPRSWLVTGVAGFIGSNLLEELLRLDQRVTGLDNFSTGRRKNLEEVQALVGAEQWSRFRFLEGDIGDLASCRKACAGADFVLHQAALGSVPRSIEDPLGCHESNVTGFLNMLIAVREAKAARFVYASSSAVYGDNPELPKVEQKTGRPLSPYAASKAIDEIYAAAFAQAYGFGSIGLRYFNVFGPRQDPEGAYAAVIPKWIAGLLKREPIHINGDGETTRDFCFIENVVQANLLAATTNTADAINGAYNIALGERTSLNELFALLKKSLCARDPSLPDTQPIYQDFRPGDVRHSLADISKAQCLLGYAPTHRMAEGLEVAMDWYVNDVKANKVLI
jgi:UDP-N-acetylglucosamine/UDP-N-acetylgalactosamine 4-epimerase